MGDIILMKFSMYYINDLVTSYSYISGIRYVLGLDGGYVLRLSIDTGLYCIEMGEWLEGDYDFLIGLLGDYVFLSLLGKLFGYGFLLYGYGGDLWLCLDRERGDGIFRRVMELFSDRGDGSGVELVNYNGVIFYKYLIKDYSSFMCILEMLGD